jgi:predicted amino acid dehydrogenase
VAQIEAAVDMATEAGCQVVGLGGYTSIVTDNGRAVASRDIAVTTGNSLTVGMGLAALEEGARGLGLELGRSTLGVVGAAGNIGQVYARMMARKVGRVILVGRSNDQRLGHLADTIVAEALAEGRSAAHPTGLAAALQGTRLRAGWTAGAPVAGLYTALAAELGAGCPLVVTDALEALQGCQLIVTTTNSARPLVRPEHLGEGPVVICDLAVPADVDPRVETERPDVLVIKGGLVQVPNRPDFRLSALPLPEGLAFACMAETMLLGLMGFHAPFSLGPVEPQRVQQAMTWADLNGFRLAGFKQGRSF